jgi:hypothetical protein
MARTIRCNFCSAILQECDIRRFKKEFEDLGYLSICTNWIGCTQCSAHQSRSPQKMFICDCCVCLKKGKETDAVIFSHSKRNYHFFESSDKNIALNDAVQRLVRLLKSMTEDWKKEKEASVDRDYFIAAFDKYLSGFERFVSARTHSFKPFRDWEDGILGAQVKRVFFEDWPQWERNVDEMNSDPAMRRGAQRLKQRMSAIFTKAGHDFPKIFQHRDEVGWMPVRSQPISRDISREIALPAFSSKAWTTVLTWQARRAVMQGAVG